MSSSNVPETISLLSPSSANHGWVFAAPDKRANSWVWNGHVKKLDPSSHPGRKDSVFCTHCEKLVKWSQSTSSLTSHMFGHHRQIYDENTLTGKEGPMDSHVVYGGEFMKRYLKWVIMTYKPYDVCNEKEFREMIECCNVKIKTLDRHNITMKAADLAVRVKQKMAILVKDRDYAITSDHWTSNGHNNFLGVTCHFIDDDWKIHSPTLCCEEHTGTQTGEAVAAAIERAYLAYGLQHDRNQATVTDTAANMNSAGMLLHSNHHYCVAHLLELVTGLAFDDANLPGADNAMAAARNLVRHFNQSTQATTVLKSYQPDMVMYEDGTKCFPVGVIQDVTTRWWSTYQMTSRLLRLKNAISQMDDDGKLNCNLNDMQWLAIKQITLLLKPFMAAQQALEGQNYVTVSLIPYLIAVIRQSLSAMVDDMTIIESVRNLAKLMLEDFIKRFGSGLDGTVLHENETRGERQRQKGIPIKVLLAAALDPRTKTLEGISPIDQQGIWLKLREEVLLIYQQQVPEQPAVENHAVIPPPQRPRVNDEDNRNVFARLNAATVASSNNNTQRGAVYDAQQLNIMVNIEVDQFRTAVGLGMYNETDMTYNNPLDWWRKNESRFPHIAKLAKKLLCIPATSAPAERLFSHAGLIISKTRAALKPENAATAVLLHDSWYLVEDLL